ncbi:ECF transporter S component [Collinsella tanakaei]|uniref:ECF transporter S component n=1 Tax=Collinsella tanakaei TaxID=626935 RepID=UPI00315B3C76
MAEQSRHIHFENTNRWSTKQLVTMALMCAVSALFMFVQIPLIPAAPFLTYDPSLVPAMVSGFAYGPGSGVAVGVLAVVIHALTTGDWVGALMNIVACVCFILPAALVYRSKRTFMGAVVGLALGVVCATAASVVSNLTIGVWFWYGSADAILPLMVPAVIPFNLAKTVLNSVLTLAVYKAISNLITPEKDRVRGRA